MMRYQQEIVPIDLMINWEIEVEWVCWFDLRCVWFDSNWDPIVWDLKNNSILMKWRRACCYSMRDVSVLSSSTLLIESFQCWVCSASTLQVWSNSSFSMEICWFLLFRSTWTFSNLSNVLILLEYYWENNTIYSQMVLGGFVSDAKNRDGLRAIFITIFEPFKTPFRRPRISSAL
jgi:hypothetical protein